MLRLFLSHLLGVWLLLSLRAREIPAQEEVLKACGREFVRLQIRICGSLSWGKSSQQHREPRQAPAALPGERSGPRRSPLPIGCGRAAGPFGSAPALGGSRPRWLPALSPDSEVADA